MLYKVRVTITDTKITVGHGDYVRGAVTGLGAVNVFAALADLAALLRRQPTP